MCVFFLSNETLITFQKHWIKGRFAFFLLKQLACKGLEVPWFWVIKGAGLYKCSILQGYLEVD